ncbi:unnamed protein product [Pylaiella littoralis]
MAAASNTGERNVVGEQRNWEQRVTSELEVAKAWCESWGPLFEGATTQQQQLESLEEKLKGMPGEQGTRTNYQLSFTGETPFDEYPVGLTNQKPLSMDDVEKLAKKIMADQTRGAKTVASPRCP